VGGKKKEREKGTRVREGVGFLYDIERSKKVQGGKKERERRGKNPHE
jgi:hypothetical protein